MGLVANKANIIEFLEREYIVPDGPATGNRIDFADWGWQEQILADLTETLDKEGKRQYTAAVVSTPRQQGKSLILQVIGAYFLYDGGGGSNLNIYSIACDREQAALVPDRVKKAINLNPGLACDVKVTRNVIENRVNGNKWTILTSDKASAPGISADVILWDELGMLPEHSWNLFYLLLPTTSARSEPLMVIASTVGESEEGPLDTFMRIGRDGAEIETYLYETTEIQSPLTNRKQIERDRKAMPPAVFARHYENIIMRGAAFLSDDQIEGIIRKKPKDGVPAITHGDYIGNDWGLTKDKCAVVRLGKEGPSLFQWTGSKVFVGTKEDPVDLNEAEQAVRYFYRPGRTRKVVFDKWQAVQAIQTLQGEWGKSMVEGYDITKPFRRKLFKCLFTIARERQLAIYSDKLQDCWKRSCETCEHSLRCGEQNAHDFLHELQGLRCDSNFDVTHGKRGDDIAFAVAEALLAGSQGLQVGAAKQYTGRY